MRVTKNYLENKVSELNQWLVNNPVSHRLTPLKRHNRNYYVNKLIELEETGANSIFVPRANRPQRIVEFGNGQTIELA